MASREEGSILAMPRPELVLWLVGFMIASTVILAWFAPEWSWLRIGFGGVFMGAMSFYMLFINRLLVS